jgi:diguanylate cyclase (GGDEF)-like protein
MKSRRLVPSSSFLPRHSVGLLPALWLVFLLGCLSTLVLAAEQPVSSTLASADEIQALVKSAEELLARNRYDEAAAVLTTAYDLAGDPVHSPAARNVLNSLANLHYNTGQMELAERYFQDLVTLDTLNDDLPALAVTLFNLGHVAASGQRFTEAEGYFRRSLELSLALGDASGTAYTRKALGVNAQARGDGVTARTYLEEALATFTTLGDTGQRAAVLRNLGDIERELGNPALAVDHYLEALPVLGESGQNTPLLRTYRGLSLAFEQLGEWEQALSAQRAYTGLLQTTLEQQGSDSTQRLQIELDTRRYADDNQRLHDLSAEQEQELAQGAQVQRLQLLVLMLAGALLLLVLGMNRRNRNLARRMHTLANTDELTKLLNRRAIMEHGTREWHRTLRTGEAFTCMVLDLDHFKAINDSFGHATGDTVLRVLADILAAISRQSDAIGRVGGEEFLLFAAGADARHALGLAERIRARVEQAEVAELGSRRLTISIGLACRGRQTSLEELIKHADKALYQAKLNGRNRTSLYQPERVRPQLTLLEGGALRT